MGWPDDEDGDVFRRLELNKFDFSREYEIDFNVEFETWPPQMEALGVLRDRYGNIRVIEPGDDYNGYVQLSIVKKLNYPLVIEIQDIVSRLMAPYGGVCDSWGVMQD
ncbi:MAG: ribonuclease E inhibitor RraB [Gammaproteobacteria bacterium]|nr:ribonuclease E inhibitor RraB [Gammaproteobacteria bacterium]MDH5800900.1 ribonuclease E inhibitor RraB [Gammaproteobacteria bacterium]